MQSHLTARRRGVPERVSYLNHRAEIPAALTALEIPHPRPVVVLVGGAGNIAFRDRFAVRKATRVLARLAEATQAVVIDGGTRAGIMTGIGQHRAWKQFSFPLVGVVVASVLQKERARSILEPNHTHFFLVPGEKWGDESPWIARIATAIAGDRKSMTVLVNGGTISRTDVANSLAENRLTVLLRGTGRMADELELADNMLAVDISEPVDSILDSLQRKLT